MFFFYFLFMKEKKFPGFLDFYNGRTVVLVWQRVSVYQLMITWQPLMGF